jgi:predicted nucleic acid-binding protein
MKCPPLPTFNYGWDTFVYDTAYLELAIRSSLPIATKDSALKRAMASCGVKTVEL